MTMHTLAVPYADTRAEQLTLAIGEPALPALAQHEWPFGDIIIDLRLLGASHQVIVSDTDTGTFSETVACLPGRTESLPTEYRDSRYRFDAEITVVSDAALRETVDRLTAHADTAHAADAPVLIARFPRDPLAVTALFAQFDGTLVTWQSWHVYPQSGEVVVTQSQLDCAA
ncbi:DUF2617 family protein [Gordonia sp. CPCC 205333]|uniref:DUF2617 family protein n=1 Tax=Gordonia sp. CPCC 205333 TaxID=3140790 RepID=UPI003AF40B1B